MKLSSEMQKKILSSEQEVFIHHTNEFLDHETVFVSKIDKDIVKIIESADYYDEFHILGYLNKKNGAFISADEKVNTQNGLASDLIDTNGPFQLIGSIYENAQKIIADSLDFFLENILTEDGRLDSKEISNICRSFGISAYSSTEKAYVDGAPEHFSSLLFMDPTLTISDCFHQAYYPGCDSNQANRIVANIASMTFKELSFPSDLVAKVVFAEAGEKRKIQSEVLRYILSKNDGNILLTTVRMINSYQKATRYLKEMPENEKALCKNLYDYVAEKKKQKTDQEDSNYNDFCNEKVRVFLSNNSELIFYFSSIFHDFTPMGVMHMGYRGEFTTHALSEVAVIKHRNKFLYKGGK